MNISQSLSEGPIYESTEFSLICVAYFPGVVDTNISFTMSWTDPLGNPITNDGRRSVLNDGFTSTLVFYPIGINDNGTYHCNIFVIEGLNTTLSSDFLTIKRMLTYLSLNYHDQLVFFLSGLPSLQIKLSTSGSAELGGTLDITCTVNTVEHLVGRPDVFWLKTDEVSSGTLNALGIPYTNFTAGSETNVTLTLDPVSLENRGLYFCQAYYNETSYTFSSDSQYEVYELILPCKFMAYLKLVVKMELLP